MLFCMWQRTGYARVVEQFVYIHAQCMPKSWVLFLNTSPYMCSAYCNCQVWILCMWCVLLVVISSSLLVMCRVHNTLRVLRMKWSEYGIFNLTYFFWCWAVDKLVLVPWCLNCYFLLVNELLLWCIDVSSRVTKLLTCRRLERTRSIDNDSVLGAALC